MPLDVMKTRMMNAPPGTYSVRSRVIDALYNCILSTQVAENKQA